MNALVQRTSLLLILILGTSLVACEEKTEMEEMTENLENAQEDIEKAAKNLEKSLEEGELDDAIDGIAGALGALGKAVGDEDIVVIEFKDLKELCEEELGDFKRVSSSGEKTSTFGISVSEANCSYIDEDTDASLDLNIVDIGSMSGLATLGLAWANSEYERESDDGYERTIEFREHRALETFSYRDGKKGDGLFSVFVNKRLHVEFESDGSTESDLEDARDDFDWRRAERMSKK